MRNKVIHLNKGRKIDTPQVGRIVKFDDDGIVYIDYDTNPHGPLRARLCGNVCQKISPVSANGEVLIVFENGQSDRPIIIDIVYERYSHFQKEDTVAAELTISDELPNDAIIDGNRIAFNATDEIELRCGKSSITLTKSGKVIIRGAYLLNRSTGVNHIKGGSVKIN